MVGLYLFLPFPAPNFFASWKRVEKLYSNKWNVKKSDQDASEIFRSSVCVNVSVW